MKFHYCGLHCGIQGDGLPPIFFLLMSLGWLVTAIESHDERIPGPSGILMCESHCRLTVGCSRRVFNEYNLSCSCKVYRSVAKDTYYKSLKGYKKGAKIFSRRDGNSVCTLIRTKPGKIESGNPSPKISHRSKTLSNCKKTDLLLDNKTVTGYLFPPIPNSIIYIKSIGVMILSKQCTFFHLRVFFKGSRLVNIKAYPASSLVNGNHWTNHKRWKSRTIAQDVRKSTSYELIFISTLRRTHLAPVEKSPNEPRLIVNSKKNADMGIKWVTQIQKCVI